MSSSCWMFWTVWQRDCLYCWSWNNTVPVNASFALPTILISASSVSCTASLGVFWEASGDHSWPGSTRHYCCSLWGARGHTQVKCVRSIMQCTVLCSLWTVQSCTLLYFQAAWKLRAGHQLYGTQTKHGQVRAEVGFPHNVLYNRSVHVFMGWNSFQSVLLLIFCFMI